MTAVDTAHGSGIDFAAVQFRTERIKEGVYVIGSGAGGNVGVYVGREGVVVIDDEYAPLSGRLLEAIAAITDQPVDFVLNTHWHTDHTGGNEALARSGALIVAHSNARMRMRERQTIRGYPPIEPLPEAGWPTATFTRDITLHFDGETIDILHMPRAHTDGDAIVFLRDSDVLHVGDIYIPYNYPYIDIDTGGSVEGTISSVRMILDLIGEETVIISGHAPPSKKPDMVAYLEMMVDTSGKVRALAKRGAAAIEVHASRPTREYDDRWGSGFVSGREYVDMLYRNFIDDDASESAGATPSN